MAKTYFLTATLMVLHLSVFAQLDGSRYQDSLQLVGLYNATNGSNWTTKWILTQSMSTWKGVTLTNGRVTRVSLYQNNLNGNIPNLNLPELEELFLDNNSLISNIPNFSLPNLKRLSLMSNRLSGNIPNCYLPKLEGFLVAFNQLSGSIPKFSSLSLVTIWLQGNQLSGSIPELDLPNLYSLILWGNQLSGNIPNFNLPALKYLHLQNNQLTGCIPQNIRTNSPLITASGGNVSGNSNLSTQNWANYWNTGEGSCSPCRVLISSAIPTAYCTTNGKITVNWVGGTSPYTIRYTGTLNGSIPSVSTTSYTLSGLITGSYTISVTDVNNCTAPSTSVSIDNACRCQDSLQLVALYNAAGGTNWTNKWDLTKPINTWYGVSLTESGCVKCIDLDGTPDCVSTASTGNNLSGVLPNLNLPKLEVLQLGKNLLRGNIPNFNLPNLKLLHLSQNQFSGTIPNFNLPNLRLLDLAYNRLSGNLPNFNLPKLRHLGCYYNQLSGDIPNFNLPNLEDLVLGANQLSGKIPNFNLRNLKLLWLSNNLLRSEIPNFNLPNLKSLYLESNQLTGCIPSGIRVNCPLIKADGGNLSNNPNLTTQNWANYWNNREGTCPTVFGRAITAYQCGNRSYRLPSGRFADTIGFYKDTLQVERGNAADTIFHIQLLRDTSCRCQDSLYLAWSYHTSGGKPSSWNLDAPMNTWQGLTLNTQGCVISYQNPKPDTSVSVSMGSTVILKTGFDVFSSLLLYNSVSNTWTQNTIIRGTADSLRITISARDTGVYNRRVTFTKPFPALPYLQFMDGRRIRLKIASATSQSLATNNDKNNKPVAMGNSKSAQPTDILFQNSISYLKSFEKQASLYPNPVSNDLVFIEYPPSVKTLKIVTLFGQVIKTVGCDEAGGTMQINVSDLPRGFYLLQIDWAKTIKFNKL